MPAPDGRIVLLLTSPRVAPGLLSWSAWQRLAEADTVLTAGVDEGWAQALEQAGIAVRNLAHLPVAQRAGEAVAAADPGREVVWFGSPDGDPGLTDALAEHLSRRAVAGRPPEVELITGSHDVPGSRLLDLVVVMDQLRSPGGCPWDAEQTHLSLLTYLLEEAHEVVDAVHRGDRDHLVEELGDLLLQVVFHARLGEEDAAAPFDIDDVAAGIVSKLVRRHPHVFGDTTGSTAHVDGSEAVSHNWEQIKAAEKQRTGPFDGIPLTLPALARAQKMLGRLRAATPSEALPEAADAAELLVGAAGDDVLVRRLLEVVVLAADADIDAEGALRSALARLADDPQATVTPGAAQPALDRRGPPA